MTDKTREYRDDFVLAAVAAYVQPEHRNDFLAIANYGPKFGGPDGGFEDEGARLFEGAPRAERAADEPSETGQTINKGSSPLTLSHAKNLLKKPFDLRNLIENAARHARDRYAVITWGASTKDMAGVTNYPEFGRKRGASSRAPQGAWQARGQARATDLGSLRLRRGRQG
jgi:hypothetical protein